MRKNLLSHWLVEIDQRFDSPKSSTPVLNNLSEYNSYINISCEKENYLRSTYLIFKILFDFLFASILLILLLPLIVLISIVIFFSSEGPIFYIQPRLGKHGKVFNILKFRTYHFEHIKKNNSEDNYIEWYGKFLRNSKLDEIPQLLNVLKGELSIVGPRPLPIKESQFCTEAYLKRYTVTPGLTGLWQSRVPEPSTISEKIRIDAEYVDKMGLLIDLKIILATPYAIFQNWRYSDNGFKDENS